MIANYTRRNTQDLTYTYICMYVRNSLLLTLTGYCRIIYKVLYIHIIYIGYFINNENY